MKILDLEPALDYCTSLRTIPLEVYTTAMIELKLKFSWIKENIPVQGMDNLLGPKTYVGGERSSLREWSAVFSALHSGF